MLDNYHFTKNSIKNNWGLKHDFLVSQSCPSVVLPLVIINRQGRTVPHLNFDLPPLHSLCNMILMILLILHRRIPLSYSFFQANSIRAFSSRSTYENKQPIGRSSTWIHNYTQKQKFSLQSNNNQNTIYPSAWTYISSKKNPTTT